MIDLTINAEIDLISAYAAILSSLIGAWEFIKWKNRNSIKLICTPNMEFFPSNDNKIYIVANVTNKGSQPTTLTHFIAYYWENRFDKLFKRNRQNFLICSETIPKVLNPGEQWMGQAEQNEDIEDKAKNGLLYIGVIHSMNDGEILQRIKIIKNDKDSENKKNGITS